jgi:DNA-binding transcriptional MerR regulator
MPGAVASRRGAGRGAAAEQLTVDELSARTGVSSRTIRFYQTEDILPPPLRRGRIALYGELHVERLRLVSMLQGRGLRLTAIRDVLRRARPAAVSLHAWLGLDETLRAPWTDDAPRTLREDELHRLLANHGSITTAALLDADLVRESDDGGYTVPSPALLEIALRLDAAGIDLDTAVAAAAIIRDRLAPAAEQLVAHFAERVGRGFGRAATPADLARAFDVLRPLGVEAVRIVFGQEVQRAIRALLGETSAEAPPGHVGLPHVDRRSREGRRRLPRSRPRR